MKALLTETLAVLVVGGLLGLGANALSTRGIPLVRSHLPPPPRPLTNAIPGTAVTEAGNAVWRELANHGIRVVDSNFVSQAFGDPRRSQHLVIFIDARADADYQRGHIPGAYQLDYYRPAPYLPIVMTAAQVADTAVIYCNGGNCEDSKLAAFMLRDAGIPPAKLHVYAGGFSEWATNGMPVELGPQNSGMLKGP